MYISGILLKNSKGLAAPSKKNCILLIYESSKPLQKLQGLAAPSKKNCLFIIYESSQPLQKFLKSLIMMQIWFPLVILLNRVHRFRISNQFSKIIIVNQFSIINLDFRNFKFFYKIPDVYIRDFIKKPKIYKVFNNVANMISFSNFTKSSA